MDQVRDICSTALSVRKANGRRVRLPLQTLTIASPDLAGVEDFVDIIRDEVNVRSVVLRNDVGTVAKQELQVSPKVLGPRLGGEVQKVIAAVKAGKWSMVNGHPEAAGHVLQDGEYSLKMVAEEGAASAALGSVSGVVVLDVNVTPELEAEGVARDIIRVLQQTRRSQDFDVSDRIVLSLEVTEAMTTQITPHLDMIGTEVLAVSVVLGAGQGDPQHVEAIDGSEVRIWVKRA
jgi:isoleucyl-tRNA synthetase